MKAALACLLYCIASLALGQSQSTTYPAGTKIAILPIVNIAGTHWADLERDQCKAAMDYLKGEFQGRKFALIPDADVAAAVAAVGLDLQNEDNQSAETLYKIGERTGAQLVLLMVITDTFQDMHDAQYIGTVRMKSWLIDVAAHQSIFGGHNSRGISKGNKGSLFGGKGSRQQVRAARLAAEDSLKGFFGEDSKK